MRLQTDPSCFSITAFLADQVTLVARHEDLPPGAALLRIHDLSRSPEGRARLLGIIADAAERETNPDETAKIAAIHGELVAWGYGDALAGDQVHDNKRTHRAAA